MPGDNQHRAADLGSGRLCDALELFPLAALALDAGGHALAVSSEWTSLTGQIETLALGTGWQELVAGSEILNSVLEAASGGAPCVLDAEAKIASGFRWTRWWIGSRRISGRDLVVAAVADVHAEHEREVDLYRLATHDELTGLYNRTYFMDAARRALARSARTGQPVGVAFIDIDGLKAVNDTDGHPAGDALISAAGQRISGCSRDGDIVARVGGDEFAVLCSDVAGLAGLHAVTERLRRALTEGPVEFGERSFTLSASIGTALAEPGSASSAEDLLEVADRNMYSEKRARYGDAEMIGPHQIVVELRDTMRRIEEIIGARD